MLDVLNLAAKISLDSSGFDKGLDSASQRTSVFGDMFKANISSGLVSKGFSLLVDGAKKGAEAIGGLVKSAVEGYATQEQMIGGVQKLYGDAANQIIKYANNAYKTSGMSANQYMETATQFSASLIGSLKGNTQKAAEQTDVAMRAISDNVNVFGSNMEDVTNAFKGFSKQNYTMLDNLKLGYGGTKTEMERLIDDANKYAESIGQASDLSIDSFSDIVTAIELVQEKQGIAGTTAKEAATTIEGSINMLKTAWENLKTGIGDPEADLDQLVDNVIDSAGHVVTNVMPILEKAIEGVGTLVERVAPVIIQKLPDVVSNLLPKIIQAIGQLFVSIGSVIPELLQSIFDVVSSSFPNLISNVMTGLQGLAQAIIDSMPQWVQTGVQIINSIASGLVQGIPQFLANALPMLQQFTATLRQNIGLIVDAGINLIINLAKGLAEALPTLIEYVPTIISNIAGVINDNMPKILEAGIQIIIILIKGIIQSIPTLVENIPQIIRAIVDVWTAFNWIDLGKNLIKWIGDGIRNLAQQLPDALKNIGQKAWDALKNIDWRGVGSSLIEAIKGGISGVGNLVWDAMKAVGQGAKDSFKNIVSDAANWGKDIIGNIVNGIKSKISDVVGAVTGVAEKIKEKLHFSEPDNGPLKGFHTWPVDMMQSYVSGIRDNIGLVDSAAADVAKTVKNGFSVNPDALGVNTVSGSLNSGITAVNGATGAFNQTVNIYSPKELSPAETARQTRNATRKMVLALRGS